jgi:hypothetical protein
MVAKSSCATVIQTAARIGRLIGPLTVGALTLTYGPQARQRTRVSFAKKTVRPQPRPRTRVSGAPGLLLRALLLGAIAIAGAAWALVRHYTHPLPPLRVPLTPSSAPTYDADAGEMPVPELELSGPEGR